MTVTRTPVNPWPWSLAFGFNQAELVEGASRVLVLSGQAAVSAEGAPQHPGDLPAQLALAGQHRDGAPGRRDDAARRRPHQRLHD